MKPIKYTVLIIPDNGDNNRQFSISRKGFIFSIFIFFIIVSGFIGFGLYTIPKTIEFQEMQNKYEDLAKERLAVMDLMQDLQRMKKMDQMIRKTLGTDLKFTPAEGLEDGYPDQTSQDFIEEDIHISYVENIPSLAPIQGYVTQRLTKSSIFQHQNHYGIDIAVKEGEPVLASAAGFVVFSGWTYDMGNTVILYHGDGYFTHYSHNQQNLTQQRNFVKRGEVIALAGSTGISSGSHLHFEIWKDGNAIDPMIFFPEYNITDMSPVFNE